MDFLGLGTPNLAFLHTSTYYFVFNCFLLKLALLFYLCFCGWCENLKKIKQVQIKKMLENVIDKVIAKYKIGVER